jgi:lipoate-protein ligase A
MGEVWTDALTGLGVDAHLVSIAEARTASAAGVDPEIRMACFGTLSPYEVTAAGRKLVGLAQVRRRTGVLLQSAIHRHFDADAIGGLLSPSGGLARRLRDVAVGLDELLPDAPGQDDLIERVERTMRDRYRVELEEGAWTAEELRGLKMSGEELRASVGQDGANAPAR